MHDLNFKAFLEAEDAKQGDYITSLTSVLGIEPRLIKKALKNASPILMSQKVFDKRQIGVAPVVIEPNDNSTGAKISIAADMSPYVFINDRLNKNAKKKLKAFVGRDQMDKLFTLGFPGSEGKPEGQGDAGGAPPADLGGAIV
jgi:hypothetical protein